MTFDSDRNHRRRCQRQP